jgi:6-pyruvoyltetrahydropterin/6-carboxytetrahydropterin synthase
MPFYSTKTYTHAEGLSCCFRQWRATHSHCSYLHGYALAVEIRFVAERLDERGWVVDFGGMKEVKALLHDLLDHKTLVAADDPELPRFREMAAAGLLDLRVVPDVGCEAFAYLVYEQVRKWLASYEDAEGMHRVSLASVEIREHDGNAARYEPTPQR